MNALALCEACSAPWAVAAAGSTWVSRTMPCCCSFPFCILPGCSSPGSRVSRLPGFRGGLGGREKAGQRPSPLEHTNSRCPGTRPVHSSTSSQVPSHWPAHIDLARGFWGQQLVVVVDPLPALVTWTFSVPTGLSWSSALCCLKGREPHALRLVQSLRPAAPG